MRDEQIRLKEVCEMTGDEKMEIQYFEPKTLFRRLQKTLQKNRRDLRHTCFAGISERVKASDTAL